MNMHKGWLVTACAVSLGLASGCHNKKKEEEAQQKAEQAKVEARAQELANKLAPELVDKERSDERAKQAAETKAERDKMQKDPKAFFEVSGLKVFDLPKGMHSVQALTLTNKSKFAVELVVARVDFMKDGLPAAQIPLKLTGSVPAGGTRTFSVADNTLEGASVEADSGDTQVSVTSVVLAPASAATAALVTQ
jgi:outer membrane murein-binding lipoprotein Lpp